MANKKPSSLVFTAFSWPKEFSSVDEMLDAICVQQEPDMQTTQTLTIDNIVIHDGYKRLFAALISSAIGDLESFNYAERKAAYDWLTAHERPKIYPTITFSFCCWILGINSNAILEQISRLSELNDAELKRMFHKIRCANSF